MNAVDAPTALRLDTAPLLEAQRRALEMIVRGAPLAEVLAALCRIVEAQAPAPVKAAILLLDQDSGELRTGAAPGLPDAYNRAIEGVRIAPDLGTCAAAAARREVVVTPDIASDPAWATLRGPTLALGLAAAWSMPIFGADGRVLGTFGAYFVDKREPDEVERALVGTLVHTAALAIERAHQDDAVRRREAQHRFLDALAAATQPLAEPDPIMATAARLLGEHLGADRCAYAQIEDGAVAVVTGEWGPHVASVAGRWPLAAFGTECERRLRAGEAYVVNDTRHDPTIGPEELVAFDALGVAASIGVALSKGGVLSAVMAVHQSVPRRWTAEEIALVELVVGRCWESIERARITRTLQASEERYRAMVEANPECVKLVGPDGTLLQMNAAGLRLVEAAGEDDVVGGCVYPLIAEEHREAFRTLNERVCRGERAQLEFEIVGLGGTRRWMETTAVPMPLPSGGHAQLAVTRDVTARIEADRALAESRARLDYAVRLSGVGFWYCDLPFDELAWDERVKAHFFLPPDARVTIETFYERIHPADREATRAAIAHSIDTRSPYDVFYRTTDPGSDAFKWIRALGGTAYGPDGTPIRFDGVTVDVTAQKQGELRLARMLEREREQARLLAQVAAAARTIHACSSVDSVLRVITEEARRIIGAHQAVTSLSVNRDWAQSINAVSLSDKYARWRDYASPPTGAGIYARVCETNQPMRMTQAELEAHPRWRRFSGEGAVHPPMRGWLAVPYIAHDGSNLGLVQLSDKYDGEFTDADEAVLQQLAQIAAVALENARLYDRLREQDRRKDEFLATLAHELRNPLAPIRTGLQILRTTHDAAQAESTRAVMERQLGHLVRLVDELLDVSRVTLGKISLDLRRIDVRDAIDSAVEATRGAIEGGAHSLELRVPRASVSVDADLTRLSQVIANLLHNASKYTPCGGLIEVEVRERDDGVVIDVRDNGAGIPVDMLGRVFDVFTQVESTLDRAQGGLGIGLTLVRRLVELHGGRVEARSEGIGRGSTFTVVLPRPVGHGRLRTDHCNADAAPIERSLHLLVVDDNVDAATTLAMLLELEGHEVRIAHTGPDALEAVRTHPPDVVFLDIGLPGLDGYEVARRLRASPGPAPLLVAVTGWGNDEDRRLAQRAGFDLHLVKPVDPAALAGVLARAVAP